MKNYTIHFLVLTVLTVAIGFSGYDFPGGSVVRFVALISGIALMISCLDAVILSRKQRKLKKQTQKVEE